MQTLFGSMLAVSCATATAPVRPLAMFPDGQFWVRHWRTGRWGLVVQIDDASEKYYIFFPDIQAHEWRWASAFVPSDRKMPVDPYA